MKVEIGVPTFNRPRVLGQCLAALLSQTYTDWDLTIIDDSPDVAWHPFTILWLELIAEAGHQIQVVNAGGWGQVAAHNWVLYNTQAEAVLRLDDDIILNVDALQHLVEALKVDRNIGAVAGLYFYPHERGDMPENWDELPETDGLVRPHLNSHRQQVSYHFLRRNEWQRVEHLYSSCLYRVEATRQSGGWPEVYSQGVACGEETEGTFKMHLAGWPLYVIPQATGVHLWADGGIRSQGQRHVDAHYQADTRLLASRLPELRSTNFTQPIRVGVYGQFHFGIGGAQKLFFHLVSLLQQREDLDAYPIFRGPYWNPDAVQELFGVRYEMRAEPGRVDVLICLGHRVIITTPARRVIHYTLFPDESGGLGVPAQFVGISPFTSQWIGERWGKPSRTLCPPVRPILAGEKENWILVAGRLEPAKGYLELIQAFVEMDLEGWELHIVGSGTQSVHLEYEIGIRQIADDLPNVTLHYNIPREDLEDLFGKASILWAAKGIRSRETSEYRPNLCEHYGYTPIEAATARCVPVAFDDGGHQFTVPEPCRWRTFEQLKEITLKLIDDPSWREDMCKEAQGLAAQFTDEKAYLEKWARLIRRVHGMAVDCREPKITVGVGPLKVGCIVDHPSLTTGFGVVARPIVDAFHKAGFQVSVLGSYSPANPRFGVDLPYPVWRSCRHSPDGIDAVGDFLRGERPDVLWINKDIGAIGEFVAQAQQNDYKGPIVAYFPVESLPLWRGYVNIISALDRPVTYLSFGAKAIEDRIGRPVEWLAHGVDHAPFRRLPDEERQRLREEVGWANQWVVGYVARNKGVKAHWRLIYAAAILRKMGMDDLLVYLHCRPTEYGYNEGFDLRDVAASCGVEDIIVFPPVETEAGHGVPFDATPAWGGAGGLAALSLVELYNCFSFYCHPAEAEGFGLPPLEAMACGVPVAVTHDNMAMTEVVGDAAILMGVEGKSMWFTMAQKANVSPAIIAHVIKQARGDPDWLAELAERGEQHAAQFRWGPTYERMVEIVRETHEAWLQKTP